jgi:hypothetical protein
MQLSFHPAAIRAHLWQAAAVSRIDNGFTRKRVLRFRRCALAKCRLHRPTHKVGLGPVLQRLTIDAERAVDRFDLSWSECE